MIDMVNGIEYSLEAIDTLEATDSDFADSIDVLGGQANTLVISGEAASAASDTNKWTLALLESDDDSTYTAVSDSDVIGVEVGDGGDFVVIDDTNTAAWQAGSQVVIGYRGQKRYLRVGATKAASAPNLNLVVTHVKGKLRNTG